MDGGRWQTWGLYSFDLVIGAITNQLSKNIGKNLLNEKKKKFKKWYDKPG